MELDKRQARLFEFVRERHGEQKRKYTGDPYWTHLLAVANIVNDYCPDELGLIEIALCHDLLEDTETNTMDLGIVLAECGYEQLEKLWIIQGVEALTDVFTTEYRPDWNRSFRKQWECARLAKIRPEYQTVKYADLIHNTSSIVEFDKGFAKKYLAEKRDILDVMRMGNIELFIECYQTLVNAEEELKPTTMKKKTTKLDSALISDEPHEINQAAKACGVKPWVIHFAKSHIGTNDRDQVYEWVRQNIGKPTSIVLG